MKKKSLILFVLLIGLSLGLCACAHGHKHVLVQVERTEATCTEDGNVEYWECSGCKKKFANSTGTKEITDVVLHAHHELSKVSANDATCTTSGNVEYWQCSACEKKFTNSSATEEIANIVTPPRHQLTEVPSSAATCTENGNVQYWQCSACEKKFSDSAATNEIVNVVIPASHKYGAYSYDYDTKSYSASCSVCHDVSTVAAGSASYPILARDETELEDIVAHADANSFIRLANDITVTAGEYEVVLRLPDNGTLDLGGHTVTVKYNGGFLIEGTNVTLQNGNVVTDYADPKEGYAVYIGDTGENNFVTVRNLRTRGGLNVFNCEATLYDCDIDASAHKYYALWADEHSTITVESGVYRGGEIACVHSVANADPEGVGYIVLDGGEFHGKIMATYGTVLNGGTFDSDIVLTIYSQVNAQLIVNKKIHSLLHIVLGDTTNYNMVCRTDAAGNFVYETVKG